VAFLQGRTQRAHWITYARSETIEAQTAVPVGMQVDGDPIGTTPAQISVVPGALKVVVPQTIREELFSQEEAALSETIIFE
jgi:diacylglycerol kinase family enzyme